MNEPETETETETETDDNDGDELPANDTDKMELPGGFPIVPRVEGAHIVAAEKESENREPDDDSMKTRMFCGLEATIFDDGSTDPVGVDFYDPSAGESATCKACKEGWLAVGKPRETTEL
jgi:hypothetical protein